MSLRILVNQRMVAMVGIAMIAMAGCDGGGTGGTGGGPSASPTANTKAVALEFAKCMRSNGYPEFPDPTRDDAGTWSIPDSAPNVNPLPAACFQAGWEYKVATIQDQDRRVAEEMAPRREYAKCMRENGMPTFPDPDAEGNFTWPDGQRPPDDDPSLNTAAQACKDHLPRRDPNKPAPSPGS